MSSSEYAEYEAEVAAFFEQPRYRVTTYHGESESHFHLIDTYAGEDDQPAVIRTYTDLTDAVECARQYNRPDISASLYPTG